MSATATSMEERVMSSMGLAGVAEEAAPGAEEVAAEVPGTEDAFAEIEWQGAKHKIPAALKDAFLQGSDYTQKTQAVAEERRTLEQLRDIAQTSALDRDFQGSISNELQELNVIDAYLGQVGKTDWTNMTSEQMFKAKMEIDTIKERKQALKESIESKRTAFNTNFSTKLSELKAKARELASKSITGFTEETEKAVREHAKSHGLGEREIDNVLMDPRSYKILWEASEYRKVVKATGKAVTAAERVVRPGSANERMPAKTAANLNFHKAMGSAKTSAQKAGVIEQRLAGIFGKG